MWSDDIIEELRRNLVEADIARASVDHLITEMQCRVP